MPIILEHTDPSNLLDFGRFMETSKAQYELRKVLFLRLSEMQAKNPLISLRGFAKTLELQPGALSEFLNEKRQFSPQLQKKILDRLNLAPDKKQALLGVIENDQETPVELERIQIDTDSYHLVSDSVYYSILCLIETKDFNQGINFIAQRLKRTENEILVAIERLERVGYITRGDKNQMIVMDTHLMTTDDVASMSLRLRHAENLEAARSALFDLTVDKRYFRFETLAIGEEQMPAFKKAAQEFFDKLVTISKQGPKDEVYEFCFNFFPRTNLENKKPDTLQ